MKQRTALNRILADRRHAVFLCSNKRINSCATSWPLVMLVVGGFLLPAGMPAQAATFSVDYPTLVARGDLSIDGPVTRSEEGLPIGNGRMGTLLWTEGDTLRMQMNRVDVFGNNSASSSFPQRNSDYCGGCGLIGLKFTHGDAPAGETPSVFSADHCRQHLSCYDGRATVTGQDVKVEAQTWQKDDVIALQITDLRKTKNQDQEVAIELRMLRAPVVKHGNHSAISRLESRDSKLILTQELSEGNYYCGSAVAIAVKGRETESKQLDEQTIQLTLKPGRESFTVYIATSASFDRATDLAAATLKKLDAAAAEGFTAMADSNHAWWQRFWEKSLVHLHSDDGVADRLEAGYTYFLYIMASTSRGNFPTKFNGMLWTTSGDRRTWGGQYWGANQSCFYNNALSAANHLELMAPMFEMYSGMLEACALAARQQWGSRGIFIPETVAFDGLAPLPDDIAAEMRELYLLRRPWNSMSQRFRDFAATQQPHSSRWNWMVGGSVVDGRWQPGERGSGPYGPVTHIFSRGAKIAYQYWLQYEYAQDRRWLANRAYPMLKGVAEFYRNYPNVRKEADGKYHIHDVNSNEPLWGGQDTDEEIAAMMAIFPTAIRAAEILDVDSELRPIWQEFADNLAPLPQSDNVALGTATPAAGAGSVVPIWVKALKPAQKGNSGGASDGNTLPIWFFDLCTLETTGPLRETGNATAERFVPSQIGPTRRVGVLSKVPLLAATMGRADAVKVLIPAQMQGASQLPALANRMDLKEGPQTQNIERIGNAADALTTALCQSFPAAPSQPSVIRVFPAWPADWDADFTLFCRGGFLVSSSQRHGQIEFVEVQSHSGGKCRLHNPWTSSVVLYRNGSRAESLDGQLLAFDTSPGEDVFVAGSGASPAQTKRMVKP